MSSSQAKVKWRQRSKHTPGRGKHASGAPSQRRPRSKSPDTFHYTPYRTTQPPAKRPKTAFPPFLSKLKVTQMTNMELALCLITKRLLRNRSHCPRCSSSLTLGNDRMTDRKGVLRWRCNYTLQVSGRRTRCGWSRSILRDSVFDTSLPLPDWGEARHPEHASVRNHPDKEYGQCQLTLHQLCYPFYRLGCRAHLRGLWHILGIASPYCDEILVAFAFLCRLCC